MAKLIRKFPSFYGLNRRVARKLGISDALVSMVRSGVAVDRHGILAAVRRERELMRAENAEALRLLHASNSNPAGAALHALDPRQPSAGRTNIDADTVG